MAGRWVATPLMQVRVLFVAPYSYKGHNMLLSEFAKIVEETGNFIDLWDEYTEINPYCEGRWAHEQLPGLCMMILSKLNEIEARLDRLDGGRE